MANQSNILSVDITFSYTGTWNPATGFDSFADWFATYSSDISATRFDSIFGVKHTDGENVFIGNEDPYAPIVLTRLSSTKSLTTLSIHSSVDWNDQRLYGSPIYPGYPLIGYEYVSDKTFAMLYIKSSDLWKYATVSNTSGSYLGVDVGNNGDIKNSKIRIEQDNWLQLIDGLENNGPAKLDLVIDMDAYNISHPLGTLSYCLTTSVDSGQGSITQPLGCDGEPKGPNETGSSCAHDYVAGTVVNITALPVTADGWEVSDWVMTLSNAPYTVVNYFNGATAGQTAVSLIMPSFDIDVAVTFIHDDITLTLDVVGDIGGTIELSSPLGAAYDNTPHTSFVQQSVPAMPIEVTATPTNINWKVLQWKIDGVVTAASNPPGNTLLLTDLSAASGSMIISVEFTDADPCTTNELDITIVGKGSVNPPSGHYCDYEVLRLNPIPVYGYFFKEWQYDVGSGITQSGISLIVPMNAYRSVTAIFEELAGFEVSDGQLFYCSSSTDKNNVVSFDFTNDLGNPSIYDSFHFRVNFYSDVSRLKLLYSASSLADNKRWFYNDVAFEPLPSTGVSVDFGETINIIFDPEILPSQIAESQQPKLVNGSTYETPLLCGVKYYIEVESYTAVTGVFSLVKTTSLIIDCDEVDPNYWSHNKDKNNWLCSGQGKSDLQVSSSANSQSIFTGIASNLYGLFQCVWQTRREKDYQVYGAIWDSRSDYLWSSGQGLYDDMKLPAGYSPIVFSDHAENFYIAGHATEGMVAENFYIAGHATEGMVAGSIDSNIYINACPLPVSLPDSPDETSVNIFAKLCGPGTRSYLGSSYDQIKVRIREEDIDGSLVINEDKVVPVVKKKSIRLDIDGIVGAYAVRLRNSNDPDWGGWINIDNNLYYEGLRGTGTEDDDVMSTDDIAFSAYRIDNSRFIVPWDVDRNNGLKRICCQVLTTYGITNTLCIDVFFNFDVPRHVFKFYSDSAFSNLFPTLNGQYVLSLKDGDGNILVSGDTSTVYFRVIFSEPIFKNESVSPPLSYSNGDLTFNVVKQGITDIWGDTTNYPLTVSSDNKTFSGSFEISKDDGIFNKDGNSFIEIIFPETSSSTCLSDESDPYNLMIQNPLAAENKDLIPEEVYLKSQTDNVGKTFEINQLKQYYDQDDDNFKFGNPKYFRG